jgi:hypothetical protein
VLHRRTPPLSSDEHLVRRVSPSSTSSGT